MKIHTFLTKAMLLLAFAAPLQGLGRMSNADVVKLLKAGLSEENLIRAVQGADNRFDLSSAERDRLKSQGVSQAVIDAMERAVASSSPEIYNSWSQALRRVFLVEGESRSRMQFSPPKARYPGVFHLNPYSTKFRHALKGNRAGLRTLTPTPVFELELPGDANPSSFVQLARLTVKSKRREVVISASGLRGGGSGIPDGQLVPLRFEKVGETDGDLWLYRVQCDEPLSAGEYALVFYTCARYYDFGVDVEAPQ